MAATSLFDEIVQEARPTPNKLRVDEVLQEMDPEDAAQLEKALREPSIKAAQIRRVLHRREISLSESAIRNWRRIKGLEA